jgi:hypothetical protein
VSTGNRPAIRAVEVSMTVLRATAVAAVFLLVAACAPGGTGSGGPSASPSAAGDEASVAVVRSGGFAGLRDTVTVEPGGRWTATDKAGGTKVGELNAQQKHELQRLAALPALAEEGRQQRGPTNCRDAFAYTVTVTRPGDQVIVAFSDCPSDENLPQTALAIATLVTGALNN